MAIGRAGTAGEAAGSGKADTDAERAGPAGEAPTSGKSDTDAERAGPAGEAPTSDDAYGAAESVVGPTAARSGEAASRPGGVAHGDPRPGEGAARDTG
jgi:hypothetical protein